MRMTMLATVALAAMTGGCATPAERAAQMSAEVDEMIQVYGPACEKLGFQPASDPWRNCVLGLSAQKNRERFEASPRTTTCWGHRGFYNCSAF